MRIDRLDLLAYGPFTDTPISFSPGVGIHVVFGVNEAGKSSALRAISDLFFGVPGQTADNFLHPYGALKIRAAISGRKGKLEFVRRKGKSGSDLLDKAERPLSRDALTAFLGPVDRGFFERAFGLDPGRLKEGAMDLLQSGGDVGQAVLQASSGVSGLTDRLDGIEAAAGELFKKGGKTQTITILLAKLRDLEKEVNSSRLSGEKWKELSDGLASVRTGIERLQRERVALDASQGRLTRIQVVLPLLGRQRAPSEALERLARVPLLPETFDATATSAREERLRADAAEAELARQVRNLEEELSGLPVAGPLLLQGAEIEAFHQECSEMRAFRRDLPTREGELRETKARADRLASGIAPGQCLDEVSTTLPPLPVRKGLRSLVADARRLREDLSREERQLDSANEVIRLAREKLAAMGPAADPSPLARAIREAERGGDPEERLSKAEAAARRTAKALSDSLASLPGWVSREADELASLSLPGNAAIDSFQRRFAALEKEETEVSTERRRLTSERDARGAERRTFAAGRTLPTQQDVIAARQHRTKGWKLVRRIYVEREPGSQSEASLFDPDHPLVDAFERSIEAADGASDRLVDASEVAAKGAQLSQLLAETDELLAKSSSRAETLASARATLEVEWRSAWSAAGISPCPPAEMKEWLGLRDRALERLEAHRTAEGEAENARDLLERARSTLVAALAAVGREGVLPTLPFAGLRSLSEATHDTLDKQSSERSRLETAIEDSTLRVATLTAATAKAREALEEWKGEWAEGTRAIQRPASVPTEEVVAILDSCDQLETEAEKVATLRNRIGKMEDGLQAFGSSVAALCAVIASDLSPVDPIATAETLFARLGTERAAKVKRAQADDGLRKRRTQLAEECEKATAARVRLEELCREAGCASVDDLPSRLEELKENRRKRRELEDVEKELLKAGAGRSIAELEAECAGIDGDTIPAALAKLKSDRDGVDAEIGRLRQREGELGRDLGTDVGGDRSATWSQEAAGIRARIEEEARRWLHLSASAFLLRHAIELWRKENQDPLLVEAGKLFSSLTEGRFVSLLAEADEAGAPVIVAERAGGNRVLMEGLSDGTADQLYLALRLASLRRYARDAEPLPFIADDLLVSFDDGRAAAALRVLSEFGKEVQVILFTHHRHVVDLAKGCLEPGVFELHELDARLAGTA